MEKSFNMPQLPDESDFELWLKLKIKIFVLNNKVFPLVCKLLPKYKGTVYEAAVSHPTIRLSARHMAYQLVAVWQSVTDVTAKNHGIGIIAVAFGSLHTVG